MSSEMAPATESTTETPPTDIFIRNFLSTLKKVQRWKNSAFEGIDENPACTTNVKNHIADANDTVEDINNNVKELEQSSGLRALLFTDALNTNITGFLISLQAVAVFVQKEGKKINNFEDVEEGCIRTGRLVSTMHQQNRNIEISFKNPSSAAATIEYKKYVVEESEINSLEDLIRMVPKNLNTAHCSDSTLHCSTFQRTKDIERVPPKRKRKNAGEEKEAAYVPPSEASLPSTSEVPPTRTLPANRKSRQPEPVQMDNEIVISENPPSLKNSFLSGQVVSQAVQHDSIVIDELIDELIDEVIDEHEPRHDSSLKEGVEPGSTVSETLQQNQIPSGSNHHDFEEVRNTAENHDDGSDDKGKQDQKKQTPVKRELINRMHSTLTTKNRSLIPSKSDTPFFQNLMKVPRGSREWVKIFESGEQANLHNGETKAEYNESGSRLMTMEEKLDKIKVFQSVDDIGMVVPKDMTFDNLLEWIKLENENGKKRKPVISVFYINSISQEAVKRKSRVDKLLEIFKTRPDEMIVNCLSFEFTGQKMKLANVFKFPDFVRANSMVSILERALEKKKEDQKDMAENDPKKEKYVDWYLSNMPNLHKYLIFTMAGAFSETHVDAGGSPVFYHVVVGRKIFYLVELTEENLRLYEQYEKQQNGRTQSEEEVQWIVEKLEGKWTRLVIEAGETAFLPSSMLHFVFTPLDSIVLAGNFLLLDNLEDQFKVAELEERTGTAEDNRFPHFWGFMYCYLQYCLLPSLNGTDDKTELKKYGESFLRHMKVKRLKDTWYYVETQTELLNDLRKFYSKEELDRLQLTVHKPSRKRKTPANSNPGTSKM